MPNWITGNVTWYSLCNGYNGACGDCANWMYHCAWPYMAPSCYYSCGRDNPHSCHDYVYIEDACHSGAVWGQVEDCCPCSAQAPCNLGYYCGGTYYYDPQWATPLADLTQEWFIAIHGGLADGRVPVWIWQ